MLRVDPFYSVLIILFLYSCQSANRNSGGSDASENQTANEKNEQFVDAKVVKYASGTFNFRMNIPEDWQAEEYRVESQYPVINLFPTAHQGELELPLIVHANALVSYIGIYPKGYGVEFPMGDSRTYGVDQTLPLNFPVSREKSMIFLLENGDVWGYFIVPSSPPGSWEEHGFLFLQIATNNFEARCYDTETGEELHMQECDPMMGDTIKRFGTIRESDKNMLKQIAGSIRLEDVRNDSDQNQSDSGATGIRVRRPDSGALISSPVTVEGEARGNWYFEAEFTVDLVQEGEELTTAIVKAQEEWMTEDFVDFSATIHIPEVAAAGKAQLVFRNSNPSGKPELDKTYHLPVQISGQQ